MKHENYIKEKLTDYESPMDMNSMWANLEKELDQEKNKTKGFWYWSLRILPVLVLLLIGAWLIYPSLSEKAQHSETSLQSTEPINKNIKVVPEKTTSESEVITEKQKSSNTKSLKKTVEQKQQRNISTTKNNTAQETEVNTRTTPHYSSTNSTSSISNRTTLTRTTAQADSSGSRVTHISQHSTATGMPTELIQSGQQQQVVKGTADTELPAANTNIFPVVLKLSDFIWGLENLSDKMNLIKWERNLKAQLPSIDLLPSTRTPRVTKKEPYIWRASINFGQTTSFFNHMPEAQLVEVFENPDNNLAARNNSFGVSMERISDKGLKLGLDLNYINHGVIHARDEEISRSTIGDRSVVYINGFNEVTTSQTFEDVEITERAIWTFRNRHNLHSLELAATIGKEWQKGKMDFSIAAGPGINYIYAQDGFLPSDSLAFESNFVSTDPINPETSFNRVPNFLLSAKLKAQVAYKLSPRIRWYGELAAAQLVGEVSNRSSFNTRLAYLGGRTGLSYIL